ncbi:titin-like isoform X2 [Culicoides brevitarsis]|uniref:titin-like isoform X2 n=1 Tax=Culicoides brevitarsis TaxID=469753 RepID=UPI00307CAD28
MEQQKKFRRPIIPSEDFIDPDLMDTSDGKYIADWMKIRSKLPRGPRQLFDLEGAKNRPAPKLSLHYLPDNDENAENTSPESVNSEPVSNAGAKQPVECPTTTEEQQPEHNNSLFNRFANTVKSMIPHRKTQNSPRKSPRKSKGLSPRRVTLTRKEILNNIDKKSTYDVMSTPITGHRASLNASESPIRLAASSSRRISVLKPEIINKGVEEKRQNTPKKTLNNSKCTVVVLENVEIAPVEISSDDMNVEQVSPIGILQRNDNIRPKNLSNMIDQNKSRQSSSLSLSMIPERNENFEQINTDTDSGCEEIATEPRQKEIIVPETQDPDLEEHEEVPETQEEPQNEEEIVPETQEEPQDEEEIVPETQENSPPRNKRRGRRTSTSSNSSVSSGLPLPHFNESLLPINDIQTRSPFGPPLLRTILNVSQDKNETVAKSVPTKKPGKRKTSVNTEAQAYFDINKSPEKKSSPSKSSRKSSLKNINKSKKRLYSQRFEEDEVESTSPDVTETRNDEIIIPETQNDEIIIPETQEEPVSEPEQGKESRNSGEIMPPPPVPLKRGRPKKKSHAVDYVSPEDPHPREISMSVPVSVYVDSDQMSDASSKISTETTKSKRKYTKKAKKAPPVVESFETADDGCRRSKRTKYLRPLNPGEKPKLVTTEELHDVYKKYGVEQRKAEYLVRKEIKQKKEYSSASSVISSKISKKKETIKNANKESRPVLQEKLQNISEEPEAEVVSSSVQSPTKTKPMKRTKNQNATSNLASIVVQPVTDDDDEPSAKRTRKNQDNPENVTTADDDSGLHTVSENNSTSQSRQENSATIAHGEVSSTNEPAAAAAASVSVLPVNLSQRRSSQRFDWIHNLMDTKEKRDEMPFYIQEYDELASSEDIKFVDIEGVQYACYCGEKFKNCGYMKIGPNISKREAKAKKFDLRFLVLKAKDIEVKLPNMTIKPKEGSMFFVNKGVAYSIINKSSSVCLLYFTKS